MDVLSIGEQDYAEVSTSLTPMQTKILNGVLSGLLNKQIAFDLEIAEATVKAHMTMLMRKLNVRNRTQLALAAQSRMLKGSIAGLHPVLMAQLVKSSPPSS